MSTVISYTDKQIVAKIIMSDGIYLFDPNDEEYICDFLLENEIDYSEDNGNPAYAEASSWCRLAPIGSRYESDQFEIEIIDREDIEEETMGED